MTAPVGSAAKRPEFYLVHGKRGYGRRLRSAPAPARSAEGGRDARSTPSPRRASSFALGAGIVSVGDGVQVHLKEGETLGAKRLLVATGRLPEHRRPGLRAARDLQKSPSGASRSTSGRARGVWAAGDVDRHRHVHPCRQGPGAGGGGRFAPAARRGSTDTAIPAATFTDPQVASVGNTSGDDMLVGERRSVARLSTYERPARPMLLRVLRGSSAAGPGGGARDWPGGRPAAVGEPTLAIRAQAPVDVTAETIQPVPRLLRGCPLRGRRTRPPLRRKPRGGSRPRWSVEAVPDRRASPMFTRCPNLGVDVRCPSVPTRLRRCRQLRCDAPPCPSPARWRNESPPGAEVVNRADAHRKLLPFASFQTLSCAGD